MPSPSRRGMGVVGMLLLLLVFAGIGIAVSTLANQTGRSSHWFHDSQLALDLAECALKEACARMRDANGAGRATHPAFDQMFRLVSSGTVGQSVTLFSAGQGPLPPALASLLDGPIKDYSPSFSVTAKLTSFRPLWSTPLAGIPPQPGERSGVLRLTGRAAVRSSIGIKVERTLDVEKDFKVISVLPPVVGRFALFVTGQPEMDPNFIAMTLAGGNGQATGRQPLTIRAGPGIPMVSGDRLDPAAAGSLDPNVLDRSGWVFLGHGGGGAWNLKVAHGWGETGESHLLEPYVRGPVPGTFADDMARAVRQNGAVPPGAVQPSDGLYYYDQGFADDYGVVGVPDAIRSEFSGANALALPDANPIASSALRLYGSPTSFSPTLVFGSVQHQFIRRPVIVTRLTNAAGVDEDYHLYLRRLEDYHGATRTVLEQAFGDASRYASAGPRVCAVPEPEVLNHLLEGAPRGAFGANGLLTVTSSAAPSGRTYASQLLRGLSTFPVAGGGPLPDAGLTSGVVDLAGLYKEDLHKGLSALGAALGRKHTFTLANGAFAKLLRGGKLRVPGVLYVDSDQETRIPKVTVAEGGILVCRKSIRITGDVTSAPGHADPLTLVSLEGDVIVAGATTVHAYLVAASPQGRVKFGSGPLDLQGGVACGVLDLKSLLDPATRTITYSPDFDPNPADAAHYQAALRAYYSGEDRLSLSGTDVR